MSPALGGEFFTTKPPGKTNFAVLLYLEYIYLIFSLPHFFLNVLNLFMVPYSSLDTLYLRGSTFYFGLPRWH